MLDPSLPRPAVGRAFASRRNVRLADMDSAGRVRLDAVTRFLQDIAIDDVQETGWGTPDHLWFVRRIRLDVREPPLADRELELVTWCSGVASIAAGDPAAGPIAKLGQAERFHWLVSPSSTIIQPSEVHAGLCDDPAEELDHLVATLVA